MRRVCTRLKRRSSSNAGSLVIAICGLLSFVGDLTGQWRQQEGRKVLKDCQTKPSEDTGALVDNRTYFNDPAFVAGEASWGFLDNMIWFAWLAPSLYMGGVWGGHQYRMSVIFPRLIVCSPAPGEPPNTNHGHYDIRNAEESEAQRKSSSFRGRKHEIFADADSYAELLPIPFPVVCCCLRPMQRADGVTRL